jgi:hypothetical protein
LVAVEINQILAARVDAGETSRFFLTPGEITISLVSDQPRDGLCALNEKRTFATIETFLRENEVKFFRISIFPNMTLMKVDK